MEKDSKALAYENRVTHDTQGVPVLRLRDERDMYKGLMNTEQDPLEKYQRTKEANKAYFTEA